MCAALLLLYRWWRQLAWLQATTQHLLTCSAQLGRPDLVDSRCPSLFTILFLPRCLHSFYWVREPETQRLEMTLPEFVQCAQRWQARKLHLKASWAR